MSPRIASAYSLPPEILAVYAPSEVGAVEWVEKVSETEYRVHFFDSYDLWTFAAGEWKSTVC